MHLSRFCTSLSSSFIAHLPGRFLYRVFLLNPFSLHSQREREREPDTIRYIISRNKLEKSLVPAITSAFRLSRVPYYYTVHKTTHTTLFIPASPKRIPVSLIVNKQHVGVAVVAAVYSDYLYVNFENMYSKSNTYTYNKIIWHQRYELLILHVPEYTSFAESGLVSAYFWRISKSRCVKKIFDEFDEHETKA